MRVLLSPLMMTLLLTAGTEATAQSASAKTEMILPKSLNLDLIQRGQIIPECDFEKVLATPAEITCVGIAFPETSVDSDSQEVFAVDLTRQYADAVASKGWTSTTDWPLVKGFEKPVTDECSETIKILTWLVDETKAVEKRNFATSRFTFLLENGTVCGDKRKANK